MPTPVPTARQCLTPESSQALDSAVSVSRRRFHSQTTSLHVIAALLSSPSSSLREACSRTRNGVYSGKIQFKALELCLGVALDRFPTEGRKKGNGAAEEPPVSNSLMAAIRRAQANQRRQPESFQLYQQQQQSSSVAMVKVELQTLVLSILDDPVVSRVLGEAGFRSCDIKLAILRPLHQLLRHSHYRGPPMFLCNLTDENFRRIGDVLMRHKWRNPLLIGSCANDALHSFCETLDRKRGGYLLPMEIMDINVLHMGSEISKFVSENYNESLVKMRFKEVALMVEKCSGPGLVISYGDLKEFTGDVATNAVSSCVTGELTNLLDLFGAKLWFVGASTSYETFLEFSNRFPSVVRDWDLQLLPITSLRPSSGETNSKSSLTESFVPFGGFFPTSSDLTSSFVGLNQYPTRCHLCNEKCEQEIHATCKRACTASVVEHLSSSAPSRLQMNDWSTKRSLELLKTDECMGLSAKTEEMQKKRDICQHLHHTSQLARQNAYHSNSHVSPIMGLQVVDDTKKNNDNCVSNETIGSSNIFKGENDTTQPENPLSGTSTETSADFASQRNGKILKSNHFDLNELGTFALSNSSAEGGHTSPSSATSVTADRVFKPDSPSPDRPSPDSSNTRFSNFDQKDYKSLYSTLSQMISWQKDAISAISQAIARSRTKNQKHLGASIRGDIWFSFLGPDSYSKKKLAIALVEILYGSRGNFIRVDLDSLDRDSNGYDVNFRGKNAIDHVACELNKKPFSVVLLENIEKADLVVQNSLSQALRTGKFPYLHGREVSINNTVFVLTSEFYKTDKIHYCADENGNCLEESKLKAKRFPFEMIITRVDDSNVLNTSRSISYPIIINKRKSMGFSEIVKRAHKDPKLDLDLNLPPEEIESHEVGGDFEENSKVWFESFLQLVDRTVIFKAFDFDKFTEKIATDIDECFQTIIGSSCVLEVDSLAMEQILAYAYRSERNEVQDWVKNVLSRGFLDVQKKYNFTSPGGLKLIARESFDLGEKRQGIGLPPRIIVV